MQTSGDTLGLYISVPFCRSKCTFCNFASGVYSAGSMEQYVGRVIEDLRGLRSMAELRGLVLPPVLETVYLGGGTPTTLPADLFRTLMAVVHEEFTLTPGAEVTLEAAPGTLDVPVLEAALEGGITRISFGVQSFIDREARAVGRLHTRAIALADIDRVRRAGVGSINVDLIAGLPGQTATSWAESLAVLGETGVDHASVYMLEVDEDSRLGSEMLLGGTRYGAGLTPSDDAVADFYAEACERLAGFGLGQYEISNFSRVGTESRHNIKYWQRAPYVGLGLDAHSMLRTTTGQPVRFGTSDELEVFLDSTARWPDWTPVAAHAELEEAWFLGLRMNRGVSLAQLRAEFGRVAVERYAPVLATLLADGLIARKSAADGEWLALTARGQLMSNDVFAEFLGVEDTALAS